MSKSEADKGTGADERAALKALDAAVSRALDRIAELTARAEKAEARREEVEVLLQKMTLGEESPSEMAERLKELEAENEDLRRRVDEGFAGVERLLSQVRFMEGQG